MHKLLFLVAALALLPGAASTAAETRDDTELFHVLVQGKSFDAVKRLVQSEGGTITHQLHIIDAVGAKLSRDQLDRVMASADVYRHINDLDLPEVPEREEDEGDCRVRGHIELDIGPAGVQWRLYNKREQPAQLASLNFQWPAYMGELSALTLDGKNLLADQEDWTTGVDIRLAPGSGPVITHQSTLAATFDPPEGPLRTVVQRQSDFAIEAAFVGGCTTDLVPGYVDNHEDYYYNTAGGIDALHRQQVTGRGVTVAVIDSGLWEDSRLTNDTRGESRLLARYDALEDKENVVLLDESGHGTHMASIIANSAPTTRDGAPTGWYKGVAPDANLVAVKVLDRQGRAHLLDIVRAVQWVVDNRERYAIRVLNLSFAQFPRWPYWEDPVNQAVMKAWRSGVAVVAAAGNEGPDVMTVGSPGNLPYIITVGAVTDSWTTDTRDDDYIPEFSSRGPTPTGHIKPDIVALGGHMTGLIQPGSALATEQPEDILRTGEFVSTGSSQASAFVSGLLALLLQLDPELGPDQLKCKLTTSAEPAINADGRLAYSPFVQGYGYAVITRAITLGKTVCGNGDLDINADIAGNGRFHGPAIVGDNGEPSLPGLRGKLSALPEAQGPSETLRWGVKEHLERSDYQGPQDGQAFDWESMYQAEKDTIEALASPREPSP
jgi:subtilisin family serine protease